MIKPLALLVHEDPLPGSQLVHRLQDLGYRTLTIVDADLLVAAAERERPMVVLMDLASCRVDVCAAIGRLRAGAATAHVPVIAFADPQQEELPRRALAAGATLAVTDVTVVMHLPQFLEQALAVD